MAKSFYEQPTQHPNTPYGIARASLEFLGDQWSALPGPWGRTGHLHNADRFPFTVGVCEAGHLYLRNDFLGDSTHLPYDSSAAPALIGQAIAEAIGALY
ncbi:hypothetical protein ACIHFC_33175 [Streptomyces sp. NPDC052013]|uniref:hypothetical protein n=1 Tax=Streptomyces sp. NPDC052013 TaxID=3365679 RepID=UPI0037D0191A